MRDSVATVNASARPSASRKDIAISATISAIPESSAARCHFAAGTDNAFTSPPQVHVSWCDGEGDFHVRHVAPRGGGGAAVREQHACGTAQGSQRDLDAQRDTDTADPQQVGIEPVWM